MSTYASFPDSLTSFRRSSIQYLFLDTTRSVWTAQGEILLYCLSFPIKDHFCHSKATRLLVFFDFQGFHDYLSFVSVKLLKKSNGSDYKHLDFWLKIHTAAPFFNSVLHKLKVRNGLYSTE